MARSLTHRFMHTLVIFKSVIGTYSLPLHANLFSYYVLNGRAIVSLDNFYMTGEGGVLVMQSILRQVFHQIPKEIRIQYQFVLNIENLSLSFDERPLEIAAYDQAVYTQVSPIQLAFY